MISLIVPIYKRLDFLELVFQGVERQSYKNFELIVAEDNNAEETLDFLEQARKKYSFPIQHVSQEDIGFRKTKILNAAIMTASAEKIVFLDGDCIPHKHFLKEYTKAIHENAMYYGRRMFLSKKITNRILQEKSIKNLNFFSALLAGSKPLNKGIYNPFFKNIDKQTRGIVGCNWGIMRKHILEVNGFDEDYTRASVGEDTDIDWRLRAMGLRMKSMKNKAIVYHLYHERSYTFEGDTLLMQRVMAPKIKEKQIYCINGINKENETKTNP